MGDVPGDARFGLGSRLSRAVLTLALLSSVVGALLSGAAPAGAQATSPAFGKPLGVTEFDAALLGADPLAPAVEPYRDALLALDPQYLRVVVDWHKAQPDPAQPAALDAPQDGCLRGLAPCTPHRGVIDELRAAKAHGWKVLVVITGVPDWAADAPHGCEEADTSARARPVNAQGLGAYERLVRQTYDLGTSLGVHLDLWSPWNEPNHPDFISPQRLTCATAATSQAPAVYATLARAARHALADTDARFVLGETAGFRRPSPHASGVGEFIRALPDDVACGTVAYDQHEYASVSDEPAAPFARDAVAEAEGALDERVCTRGLPVWVSETGVGDASSGGMRSTDEAGLALQCDRLAARFARWRTDPRVGAVFAYTFREDTAFPVGMADAQLTRLYPTYTLWRTGSCPGTDAPDPAPTPPTTTGTTPTPAPPATTTTTTPVPPPPTGSTTGTTPVPPPTTTTPAPLPPATTTTTIPAPAPTTTTEATSATPPAAGPPPTEAASTDGPPPASTSSTPPPSPAGDLPTATPPLLPVGTMPALTPVPHVTVGAPLTLRVAIRPTTLATVLRDGLHVQPNCSERCRATVRVTITAATAKRLGLHPPTSRRRSTPVGSATRSGLGRRDTLVVHLPAKVRAALAGAGAVRLTAAVTASAGTRRATGAVARTLSG